MKIINPVYKRPEIIKAETLSIKLAQYMAGLPANQRSVTFDEIRQVAIAANLNLVEADLPDAIISHLAQLAGFDVE